MSDLQPIPSVTLTKGEHAAVLDRLNLPDCIANALTDVSDGDQPPVPESVEEVEARVQHLHRLLDRADRTLPTILSTLDRAILAESIEGSTWAAIVADEPALFRARRRVLQSAADKFVAAGIAPSIFVPEA